VEDVRVVVIATRPCKLRVFFPKFAKAKSEAFRKATWLLLEAGMGERWLLEDLAGIEVDDAKRAPKGATAIAGVGEVLRKRAKTRKPSRPSPRSR
jgi:hypothetical protein